jgi:uncharacterized protein YecT (DUF1311 family)
VKTRAALLCLAILPVAGVADPSLECSVRNGSQVEIADCLFDVEADANAALEIAFKEAMNNALELDTITTRSVAVTALEKAQADWVAFRQSHCDYLGSLFGGGSGTSIRIRSCRIHETRQRTAALFASLN